jgi:MFS family permease
MKRLADSIFTVNGLQSLQYWRDYFDDPQGSTLSVFTSIMTLGSLGALPFIPPICDKWGRKMGIYIGSVLVLLGVGLQAGATKSVLTPEFDTIADKSWLASTCLSLDGSLSGLGWVSLILLTDLLEPVK